MRAGGPRPCRRFKKKVADEGATLVCVDESAFQLLPARVRTWAPRGQTPVLRASARREHLSVISGITPEGRLFQQVLEHAVRGPDCVRFLWHLLAEIEGPLVVVWDNLPAHRGEVVRTFLRTQHGRRVELVRLPVYAPDLNPEEGIWKQLKYVELGNVSHETRAALKQGLRKAVARVRQKPEVIRGCFRQCGFV